MAAFKDSLTYLSGDIFAKTLPFLLLPYLTRKLGVADFGLLSYWQTIGALLSIFLSMSQDAAVARYFYVYGKRGLNNIITTAYAYTLTLALVLLAIAWSAQSLLLAAVVCTGTSQSILAVQLTVRQCRKQASNAVFIQAGSSISAALLTVLLLETTSSAPVLMRFTAIICANTAVSLIALGLFRHSERHGRPTRKRLLLSGSYLVSIGLPLLIYQAETFVKNHLDRFVIYQHYTTEQLGIYSAGLQTASILGVLLFSINKATLPYYYQSLKQGSLNAAIVRRWAIRLLFLIPLPPLISYMLPESLFLWLLGAQYTGAKQFITLFLIGFSLYIPYYLLFNFLLYHAQNRKISIISAVSAAAYAATLLLLLPYGTALLPYAMIISGIVILPILFYYCREPV